MSNQEPGDLVDVSRRLRQLLSAYDNASIAIESSFLLIAPELEAAAQHLRPALDESLTRLVGFLERLEKTPAFVAARATKLAEYEQ